MQTFYSKLKIKKDIHVGKKVNTLETRDTIINHSSEFGCNDNKNTFVYGQENIYFKLHQKQIPIQEYENSTLKNEYEYLHKKHEEIKGDNVTDENGGIVEYGSDFKNCNFIHSKR